MASAQELADLKTAIESYFAGVQTSLGEKVSKSEQGVLWLNAMRRTGTIAAGQTLNFDLHAESGESAGYDFDSSRIEVRILDTVSGSPTENFYINSESMLVVGISGNQTLRIHNPSDVSLQYRATVDAPAS